MSNKPPKNCQNTWLCDAALCPSIGEVYANECNGFGKDRDHPQMEQRLK